MPLNLARVRMGTLNMRDGRRGKMHHVAQCLLNHHIDVAVLTETKLQTQFDQQIGTYQFIHSEAHSSHSGGVSLAFRTDDSWFSIESVHRGVNLISFQLVTAHNRFVVVGLYIPPTDPVAAEAAGDQVMGELNKFPHNPRIILGDLNSNPHCHDICQHDIVMAANWTEWGVEDLGSHFRTCKGTRFTTWHQVAQGQLRSALCDFVLTNRRADFTKLKAVEPRYYDSDHRLVYADMRVEKSVQFRRWLRGRKDPPALPPVQHRPHLDGQLTSCFEHGEAEVTVTRQPRDQSTWVSQALLELYDSRTHLQTLCPTRAWRRALRQLKKRIKRQRKRDLQEHTIQACDRIRHSLQEKDLDSAWGWCKKWYQEASTKPHRPSPHDLEEIQAMFQERYTADGIARDPLPTHVQPFAIVDSVPNEAEIATAVRRIRNRRAKGFTGM